jgi:N-acetyl-alpha-D-muramate 1-phosphate uridylyltransferase
MLALPPVCILAGGRGTRLGDRVAEVPKPLLELAGEPFLLHQLRLLAAAGVERAVLCVGYLGDLIERTVGRERFGITIEYRYDGDELRGTLGAVRGAADLLGDRFLILYGDTYLRVDYAAAFENWQVSGCIGLMTVLRNEGRWDVSNAVFERDRVVTFDKDHPTPQMHWIDYGLGGLRRSALALLGEGEHDLSALYHHLATAGELYGYEARERFYEIGSPESLRETEAFLLGGSAHHAP